jgi:biotin-dependent carboxylase-like uncharacterized protein
MIKTPAYIHFVNAGLLTSVQDLGRFGMAVYGVPYSGVMDRFSMTQANFLLQNKFYDSVLELGGPGAKMVFEMATRVVFVGADADIYLNDKSIKAGKIIDIVEDDELHIRKFRKGQWLYMGIQGGFESEIVAESRSWYPGITPRAKIEKGDSICYLSEERFYPPLSSHPKMNLNWFRHGEINVYKGPEWDQLPKLTQNRIMKKSFTISNMVNRMAYQLEETIENEVEPILTSPVYPGTVQLTPNGNLIILMRDAQVTGGYPRILHVENNSLNILSQKTPGDKINFSL